MIKLGFLTKGKLVAIFIKTFSWGFPTGRSFYFINKCQQTFWHHHQRAINKFSGTVARKQNSYINHIFPRQLGSIKFSGAVAREEWKTSARRVSAHTSLLCYCFALLYLFYLHHFISKTQKN
jgi:hypothetical protein